MNRLFQFFFAFCFTCSLQAQDKPWAMLFADAWNDESVRLYWSLRDWPVDLAGFNLKRRDSTQKSSDWEQLNQSLLIPSSTKGQDYSNQGLSAEQASELKRIYANLNSRGQVNPVSAVDMVNLLKANGGLKSGDRIAMSSDFDLALIYGFAAVDNTADIDARYSYGLFSVLDNGTESSEPIAYFGYQPALMTDSPYLVDLQATVGSGIELTWEIKQLLSDALSLVGFQIYRRPNDEGQGWTELTKRPYSTGDVREGVMYYKFNDREANLGLEYEYAVAPVNMFQRECASSTAVYIPKVPAEAIPVEIASLQQTTASEVEISWKIPEKYVDAYESFTVLRVDSIISDYNAVSDRLSSRSNEYVDRSVGVTDSSQQYYYKLMATTHSGDQLYSKPRPMLLKPLPSRVEGLSGELFLKDGVPHVRLTWDPASDNRTQAYYLAWDRRFGKMLKDGAIGKITINQVAVSLKGNSGGRDLNFKVIPLNAAGDEGPPAELTLHLPLFKFPVISEFDADQRYNMDGAMLTWDYPSFESLKGFRLYMNEQLIADESEIAKNARGWVVIEYDFIEGKNSVAFELEAIGGYAKSYKKISYFAPDKGRDYTIPPVRSFEATQLKSESGEYLNQVRLRWKLPRDLDLSKLAGFHVFSDLDRESGKLALNPARTYSVETTECVIELPEGTRRPYQFRLVPITVNGDEGQYKEIRFFRKFN